MFRLHTGWDSPGDKGASARNEHRDRDCVAAGGHLFQHGVVGAIAGFKTAVRAISHRLAAELCVPSGWGGIVVAGQSDVTNLIADELFGFEMEFVEETVKNRGEHNTDARDESDSAK